MNTKFTLTLIVVAFLMTVAACSPAVHPMPILDKAQPAKNEETRQLIPVTAGQPYSNEQAYANQKFHSACVSENSQRQNGCQEPALPASSTMLSGNSNVDSASHPSQQSHSACVSENSQRQESCTQ